MLELRQIGETVSEQFPVYLSLVTDNHHEATNASSKAHAFGLTTTTLVIVNHEAFHIHRSDRWSDPNSSIVQQTRFSSYVLASTLEHYVILSRTCPDTKTRPWDCHRRVWMILGPSTRISSYEWRFALHCWLLGRDRGESNLSQHDGPHRSCLYRI